MCAIVPNRSVGNVSACISGCALSVICHPSSVTEVRQKVSRKEKWEIEAMFRIFSLWLGSFSLIFFFPPRFPGVKLRLKQGRQLFTYLCDRLALYTISSSWVHAFSFSDFPWQWDGIGLIWNKPDYSLYVNAFVSNVLQSTEPGPIGNYSIKRRDWRAYLFVWYARLHLQSICFNAEDVLRCVHPYIHLQTRTWGEAV